jgi:hypothetical protein
MHIADGNKKIWMLKLLLKKYDVDHIQKTILECWNVDTNRGDFIH